MISLLFSLMLAQQEAPREFYDYLTQRDSPAHWRTVSQSPSRLDIELISQTWHNHDWKHEIVMVTPKSMHFKGTAILYITGGKPNPADIAEAQLASELTAMPVAMLFEIPNQPLFGMSEDDLIAHTLERYLQTRDATWPLLFPMAKSAIRAMDAVQNTTKRSSNPIRRFIVTGASKRGWTTWFVGASMDRRVLGIAPMVIDNLNMAAQMRHQIDSWGEYSEQIKDYTNRGLQKELEKPLGKHLAAMIDPYSYRANIKVPTMIINGANDRYWTVDALNNYWGDLQQPKWVLLVPNAGHLLGSKLQALETIGAFARSLAGQFRFPRINWKYVRGPNGMEELHVSGGPGVTKLTLWVIDSPTLDFRDSQWHAVSSTTFPRDKARHMSSVLETAIPRDKNIAMFGELRFDIEGHPFSLSTQVMVVRKPR